VTRARFERASSGSNRPQILVALNFISVCEFSRNCMILLNLVSRRSDTVWA